MSEDGRRQTSIYTPRVNLDQVGLGEKRGERDKMTLRGLPSLPPLDIKRVARPSEPRQSPSGSPGQGLVSPHTSGGSTPASTPGSGSSGSPQYAGRTRKPKRGKKGRPTEQSALHDEFRALGVNSPVPATQPEGELGDHGEGSDASSTSPFPAITVQRCEEPWRPPPGRDTLCGGVSPLSPSGELSAHGLNRQDSEHLLTPTPPSHRRSLDNKYVTYSPGLASSRSEGCLEYLGNIERARDARNQRFLLDVDKAQSTQGIWISTTRRASGEISPLAVGGEFSGAAGAPGAATSSPSPPTSPLTPRKPARLLPLQYSKSKSKTA